MRAEKENEYHPIRGELDLETLHLYIYLCI